jgi:hypothetical protein
VRGVGGRGGGTSHLNKSTNTNMPSELTTQTRRRP